MKAEIEYAIKGSLDSSAGEAGIIGSTPQILRDNRLLFDVNNLDKILTVSLRQYEMTPSAAVRPQWYLLNKQPQFDGMWEKVLLRGIVNFQAFQDVNRAYNRREFYFIPENVPGLSKLFQQLAEPQKFMGMRNGSLSVIQAGGSAVSAAEAPYAICYSLFESFLKKKPAYLETTAEHLVSLIDRLPSFYKKAIQAGFNLLPNDLIFTDKLHCCSALDPGAVNEVRTAGEDPVLKEMIVGLIENTALVTKDLPPHLNGDWSVRSYLYDNFRLHYLLVACRIAQNGPTAALLNTVDLLPLACEFMLSYGRIPGLQESFMTVYAALRNLYPADENRFREFTEGVFFKSFSQEPIYEATHAIGIGDFARDILTSRNEAETFGNILNVLKSLFRGADQQSLKNLILADYLGDRHQISPDDLGAYLQFGKMNRSFFELVPLKEVLAKCKVSKQNDFSTVISELLFDLGLFPLVPPDFYGMIWEACGREKLFETLPDRLLMDPIFNDFRSVIFERAIRSQDLTASEKLVTALRVLKKTGDEFAIKWVLSSLTDYFSAKGGKEKAQPIIVDLLKQIGKYYPELLSLPELRKSVSALLILNLKQSGEQQFAKVLANIVSQNKMMLDLPVEESEEGKQQLNELTLQYPDAFNRNQVESFRKQMQTPKVSPRSEIPSWQAHSPQHHPARTGQRGQPQNPTGEQSTQPPQQPASKPRRPTWKMILSFPAKTVTYIIISFLVVAIVILLSKTMELKNNLILRESDMGVLRGQLKMDSLSILDLSKSPYKQITPDTIRKITNKDTAYYKKVKKQIVEKTKKTGSPKKPHHPRANDQQGDTTNHN